MHATRSAPRMVATKRRRRRTTRQRSRREVDAGRTVFAGSGAAGSFNRTSWIDRVFGNGKKPQSQKTARRTEAHRASSRIYSKEHDALRRGPQRKLVMSLSFALRHWERKGWPWRSERTAILGKIPASFVHRTQFVNGVDHTRVIAITRRGWSRGPAQAEDGADDERLGERSGRIAGAGEGLMVRLRGLVPLNGAADPLAKINLRDVAQQFPRPADVGKGMTNVA